MQSVTSQQCEWRIWFSFCDKVNSLNVDSSCFHEAELPMNSEEEEEEERKEVTEERVRGKPLKVRKKNERIERTKEENRKCVNRWKKRNEEKGIAERRRPCREGKKVKWKEELKGRNKGTKSMRRRIDGRKNKKNWRTEDKRKERRE